MTIAVIGGAGFIGRRLIRQLSEAGQDVVSLDVEGGAWVEAEGLKARAQRLDLADFEAVVTSFATIKPKVVINLGYMRETFPRPAVKVNVMGMDNCFEAARLCDVEHVIYASSIAVNGRQSHYGERDISEDDPTFPTYQYAHHKVFNEWQAHEYRTKHGMCITGVRVAHAAAPGKLVGAVDHVLCISEPAAGRAVELDFADKRRSVIHVDDVADIFCKIAAKAKPDHVLYNTGGQTLALGQIAQMVKAHLPDADIRFQAQTGGDAKAVACRFDNSRLRQEFGITLPPYEERVAQMITAVQAQRNG